MNVCTPGNCICDAAEWPGDTNCMGEVVGVDPFNVASGPPAYRRYYFDEAIGVTFSIDTPQLVRPGVQYYYDPELTKPVN